MAQDGGCVKIYKVKAMKRIYGDVIYYQMYIRGWQADTFQTVESAGSWMEWMSTVAGFKVGNSDILPLGSLPSTEVGVRRCEWAVECFNRKLLNL
jgi:hypothetical protein